MPFRGILDIRYGRKAKCRVRIYEHDQDEPGSEPVVLITELPDNQGEDIASAAEILVGTLLAVLSKMIDLSVYRIPLFINHYPPESTAEGDLYELVSFDESEILEIVVEQAGAGAPLESIGHEVVWSIEEAHFVPVEAEMITALLRGSG